MAGSYDAYIASWEAQEALDAQLPEGASLSGEGADPTHHIVLSDGIEEVGFVLTDQEGQFDERTFRRFPHSDPVSPYVTEKQDSWGGGFGQATFEDNRTRYWRSKGVDTTKDVLVLGSAFHYGVGSYSLAETYLDYDAGFQWYALAGSYGMMARKFTPSASWARVTYLKFFCYPVKERGKLPTLRVRICPDSGGSPDVASAVHTATFAPSTFDDITGGEWVRLNISDIYAYGTSTWWIVWDDLGDGADNAWYKIACNTTTASNSKKSVNGSSWSTMYDIFFRIESLPNPFNARFFDYKGQMYSILDFDDSSNSAMYMNGWRGLAGTGATSTQLKDSSQTEWATKITGDEIVKIIAGPASGQLEDQKPVTSGISGVLTLDEAWTVIPSSNDEYVVTNSDYFSKITTASVVSAITGKVTDVAIADGVVYFARADERNVSLFRQYHSSAGWTTEGKVTKGAKAQFVRVISDPISGDVIWFGKNVNRAGEYRPKVWQSTPAEWTDGALDFVNAGIPSGDSNQAQYWQASGADISITGGKNYVDISLSIGQLQSVAVGSSGGTGYTNGDLLTVLQAGSTKTAKVQVTVSGGVVTGGTVTVAGEDYNDTGTDITTSGGTGTGCVFDITGVNAISGQLAYIDLVDADGNPASYDIRNMTKFHADISYRTKHGSANKTSLGDFLLGLDDSAGSATPFAQESIIGLQAGSKVKDPFCTLDLTNEAGADALTSISIIATSALTKSCVIRIEGDMVFWRDIRPTIVSAIDGDNITGLEAFGDPETLWVFTESGFGQMKGNLFLPVPQREVRTARHANNGSGHGVSDVYLLFTWRGRLQRYFRQNMEDLGPDFPAGMGDIAGDVVSIVSYPGRIYVAIDAGASGKSMILCHKGGGWHEVWTGFTGERIRNLYIQSIDGKSDKLWASVGGDLMWFPIALDSAELPDNTDYRYRPVGYIESSWVYTGSRELDKIFRSILLTVDDTTNNKLRWDVWFKIDDPDAEWTKVTGSEQARSASMLEYFFTGAQGNSPRGNRIRVRLYLETHDMTTTPTIRSTQMRIYRVPEVKYSYTWLTKLSTISINLRGDEERVIGTKANVQRAYDKLDEWANGLTPLFVTSPIASIGGKQVVMSPIPSQLLLLVPDEQIQEQTIQVTVNDI